MVRGQGTPLPWLRVSFAGTALRLSDGLPLHTGLPHLHAPRNPRGSPSETPSGLLDAPLTLRNVQSSPSPSRGKVVRQPDLLQPNVGEYLVQLNGLQRPLIHRGWAVMFALALTL